MTNAGETGKGLRTRTQTTKSKEAGRQRPREAGSGADRPKTPRRAGRKAGPGRAEAAARLRLEQAVGCGGELAPPPRAISNKAPPLSCRRPVPSRPRLGYPSSLRAPVPTQPCLRICPFLFHPTTTTPSNGCAAPWLRPSPLHSAPLSSVPFSHARTYWLPVCWYHP